MTHINKTIIGITGGIATGKSTVSNILKEMDYKIIDADKIAKDLMKKYASTYKKTIKYFGDEILSVDGEIDKKILGGKVFRNPELLKTLNDITHPDIFQEIKIRVEDSCENIIFLDIPLLFEEYDHISKYGIKFNEIWLVFADKNIQIDRLMNRNKLTKDEAIRRIDSQLSIDFKKKIADRVIYNLESIDSLKEKIDLLLKDLS